MTDDVVHAIGNISDRYLDEAMQVFERKSLHYRRWLPLAACLAVVLCVGFAVLRPIISPTEKPQIAYRVGSTVQSEEYEYWYLGYTETSVCFRVRNLMDEDYAFTVAFDAYWEIHPNYYNQYEVTTGEPSSQYPIVKDKLKIYVDGEETDAVWIPADGAYHDVVIDFRKLLERGYTIGPSENYVIWYFENLCCAMEVLSKGDQRPDLGQ